MTDLLYREEQGCAFLTLNRPQVRNSLNGQIMDQLEAHVEALSMRQDLVAVVITGSQGEAFCSGGDLKWLQCFDSGSKGAEMSRRMQRVLSALSDLPLPVIGVLNGYAIGGGAELALACDIRIMEAHTYLCFKQVQVGLITGWSGGARLLDLVGYGRALELVLTCQKISAESALALGIANTVAETGCGLGEAVTMAHRMSRGAPLAIRSMKKLLRSARDARLHGVSELEASLFGELWGAPDHQEALRAFFEKRPPKFTGE
jgi:enoyl-CoA hydratase/carnithine racemase